MFDYPNAHIIPTPRRLQQLHHTRQQHLCPTCRSYAYDGRQTPVRVGNRVHHPSCRVVRGGTGKPFVSVRGEDTGASSKSDSIMPVIAGGAMLLIGGLRYFSTDVSSQDDWNARYGKR